VFANGSFDLSTDKERRLVNALQEAEMYQSVPEFVDSSHVSYVPPLTFPRHDRDVSIEIDFDSGKSGSAVVIGGDLTHEYVAENADYRS
jgi:glutamate N-acetyltransferase/amino-acid N-acetyltransferase